MSITCPSIPSRTPHERVAGIGAGHGLGEVDPAGQDPEGVGTVGQRPITGRRGLCCGRLGRGHCDRRIGDGGLAHHHLLIAPAVEHRRRDNDHNDRGDQHAGEADDHLGIEAPGSPTALVAPRVVLRVRPGVRVVGVEVNRRCAVLAPVVLAVAVLIASASSPLCGVSYGPQSVAGAIG